MAPKERSEGERDFGLRNIGGKRSSDEVSTHGWAIAGKGLIPAQPPRAFRRNTITIGVAHSFVEGSTETTDAASAPLQVQELRYWIHFTLAK